MSTTSTSTLQGAAAASATSDPPVAAPEHDDDPRYTLGEEIARGGLGRIVKGRDRRLARPVAIKELIREEGEGGGASEARFAVEALLTAQLEHPNIIPVHDLGRLPGGRAFYAMKLVSGRSLAAALAERATVAARLELLPHVVDVADAIAYAHSKGVVHRDLKPQNVLIGSFGETVVIDWGLAKVLDGGATLGGDAPTQLAGALAGALDGHSVAGAILGTPEYMAPEQALGQPADRRFDVFGIGAILYHLLTGNPPLRRTPGPIREQVVAGPSARIGELAPDAPRELVAIAERAMARDPAERYATANELALDLRRFREGQRVGAYDYTSRDILLRWVRRWRLALAAAAVALVSLVAALVVVALDRGTLASALTSAEQREVEAEARGRAAASRERTANEREAIALRREHEAVRRADALLVDQARLEAEVDPAAALRHLAQLSPDAGEPLRARVIAADALAHDVPRVLGRLDGGRFELAIAPRGDQLAWASADGTVHLIHADGRRETRARLPREGTAVTFSDDGRRLAIGSGDGAVHVVELDGAATPARRLGGHGTQIIGLAFSPDGTKLASAATEPGVRLWDLTTGAVTVLASSDTLLFGLGWSKDGRWLATSGSSATITVHTIDAPAGAAATVYDAHGLMGARFEFSPDARLLLAQDMDGRAELVTLATRHARGVAAIGASSVLSPDGRTIVVAHEDGVVDVLDVARLDAPARRLTCGTGAGGAAFGASGRQLVVSARSGVCVFATDTWERTVLVGHDGGVLRSYVATLGSAVAAIDGTGRLLLHRADPTRERATAAQVFTLGAPVNEVALTPDGRRAAATAGDAVHLIDLEHARAWPLAELPRARRAAFSPDGTLLAASGASPVIVLHDLAADITHELRGDSPSSEIAFSPDGGSLATAGRDGGIRVWDLARREAALLAAHGDSARALAWSHDGRRLASVGYDRVARVLDRETGDEVTFETPGRLMYRIAFSDDDGLVAVSGDDGTCVWSLATRAAILCDPSLGRALSLGFSGRSLIVAGALGAAVIALDAPPTAGVYTIRELGGHREVMHTAVSPERSRLATSDFVGTVRLWDIASGEGRLLAEHPGALVATMAFSADGRLIASGGLDGRVIVTRDELPLEPLALRRRIAELARARD